MTPDDLSRLAGAHELPQHVMRLNPNGHVLFGTSSFGATLDAAVAARLAAAFARGSGHGLLALALSETATALPADMDYWRAFAAQFMTAVCARPQPADDPSGEAPATPPPKPKPNVPVPLPGAAALALLADAAPPMQGAEYLSAAILADCWRAMDAALASELSDSREPLAVFLKRRRHLRSQIISRRRDRLNI